MKLYRINRVQFLPITLSAAWDFFATPQNLAVITPVWLGFTLVDETRAAMYEGMIISYRISPFWHLPVQWVTEITCLDEPYFFVDEQRAGPYRFWHHQHRFTQATGGIEMEDIVHYMLPFDPFSRIVHFLSIRKKLDEIFDFRENTLNKLFSASTPPGSLTGRRESAA